MFLLASWNPAVGFTGIVILLIHQRIAYRLLKMHLRALEGGGRSIIGFENLPDRNTVDWTRFAFNQSVPNLSIY